MASCSLRAEELVDQFESSCAVARPKNQSSLGPYIYTPLCDPSKEFRLVTLHPGRAENNDIECSLQHGHLSDHTEFEALSYAWGDQIEKHTIMLDKHSFEVTSNLAHALRNLRNVGPSNHIGRVFWIDAICINQEDVTECNDQVRRMDIIYTRASQVVVWL
ncbi:HET-domain-containing protein, partial [Cadophora sp. DSE1049]